MMAQRWPRAAGRLSLLRQWSAMSELKHVLADIALRGGVYSAKQYVPGDVFGAGVLEGRRQLALEIIETADVPYDQLYALVEKAAPTTSNERTTR
jgi:hypothetical protein